MKKIIIGGLLLSAPLMVLAEGSPWLSIPGENSLQISAVVQTADEFLRNDDEIQLPDDLEQTTVWLSYGRGLTDNLAMDFRIGYAENEFSPAGTESGVTDATIGLTWRFHDEFLSFDNFPSAAIRVAATRGGDYESGAINAIGDGASGVEASLILGKAINEKFAISGDLGYRYRDSDVPNDVFFNLTAFYSFTDKFSASVGYHNINSRGSLDIGGPGFTPARFSETEEDNENFDVALNYVVGPKLNLSLSYGSVFDGQNTPNNDVVALSVGTSF